MHSYWINNLKGLENTPVSPQNLQFKFSELLYNSYSCKAKVENVNPETGDYKIVLQGTLDCCWDENNRSCYHYGS